MAAAMRYTEARMTKITLELLRDINKDTLILSTTMMVMKESRQSYLHASQPFSERCCWDCCRYGYNIPPHNLTEVDGVLSLSKNPILQLMN